MTSDNGNRRRRRQVAESVPVRRRRPVEDIPAPARRTRLQEAAHFNHYGRELVRDDAFIDKLVLKLPNITFGNIPANRKALILQEIKSAEVFTRSQTNRIKVRAKRTGLETHRPLFGGHAFAKGFAAGEADVPPTLALELSLNLTRFVTHNFAAIQRVGIEGLIDIDPIELLYKSLTEINNKKAGSLDGTDNFLEPAEYTFCKEHKYELLQIYVLKVCELIARDLYVSVAPCNIQFGRNFFTHLDTGQLWQSQRGTSHLWGRRFSGYSRSRARTQITFGFSDWTASHVEFYWPMYPGAYEAHISHLTRDVLRIDPQASIDLHRINRQHSSQRTIASIARNNNAYSFRVPTGNAAIHSILYAKTIHQIRLEVRYRKSIRTLLTSEVVSNASIGSLIEALSGPVLMDAYERMERIYTALLAARESENSQRLVIRFIHEMVRAFKNTHAEPHEVTTLLKRLSRHGTISAHHRSNAPLNEVLLKLEELGVLVCPDTRQRSNGPKNYAIAPGYENILRLIMSN